MKLFNPWQSDYASAYAAEVDAQTLLMLTVCGATFLLLTLVVLIFLIRYRKAADRHETAPLEKTLRIELSWSFIPLVLFVGLFLVGAGSYLKASILPDNYRGIYVVGKQWMWKFQHAEGPRELGELHVPVGENIALEMISEDVIHSFYVPEFRQKQDVLPGQFTSLWFRIDRPGTYQAKCAEYCGTDHARMDARVIALSKEDFNSWLTSRGQKPNLSSVGEGLFHSYGCASCHSHEQIDNAPRLDDLYGSTVTLDTGERVLADENYLRESIRNAPAQKRAGYRAIMPIYETSLNEEEVIALIAYIKQLSHGKSPTDSEE